MNKLLKDRVRLVRGMVIGLDVLATDTCLASTYKDKHNEYVTHFVDAVKAVRKDEAGHFLSVSHEAECQISYARRPEDKYHDMRRVRSSLGRYFRRNFNFENIPDAVLDKFVSVVWAETDHYLVDPKFYYGQQITEWYKNFGSSDRKSCMTGAESVKTEIYAKNPDKVALLIWSGLRALLWTCDDGTKVLDRTYPSGHGKIPTLRQWASKKGYVLRVNPDKLEDRDTIQLSDNSIRQVTLNKPELYPYIDTFPYGKIKGDKVVLTNARNGADMFAHQTNGSVVYYNSRRCHHCDNDVRSGTGEHEFAGRIYCGHCINVVSGMCSHCGGRFRTRELVGVDGHNYCSSCLSEECGTCPRCEETHTLDNMIRNQDTEDYYCENCAEEHLGHCNACGNHMNRDSLVQNADDLDQRLCGECRMTCRECDHIIEYVEGGGICQRCENGHSIETPAAVQEPTATQVSAALNALIVAATSNPDTENEVF